LEKDLINFVKMAMATISVLSAIIFSYFNWNKSLFRRIITFVLFLASYGVIISFLAETAQMALFPHSLRTGLMVLFLISPLTYLALRKEFRGEPILKNDLFYLIPFLLYLINFFNSIFTSESRKIEIINSERFWSFEEGILFAPYVILWFTEALVIFCIIKIYQEFIKPKEITNRKNKNIAKLFIWYLIIQMTLPLIPIFGIYDALQKLPFYAFYIFGTISFYVILLSQPHLLYGELINENTEHKSEPVFNENQHTKIKHSMLTHANHELISSNDIKTAFKIEHFVLIEQLLAEKKLYLKTDFTQKELSTATGLSNFQIRQAIKAKGINNFSNYINTKRIENLLSIIKEDSKWRKYSLEFLAKESGFNSVNSFYLSFKKVTGLTPKNYLDKLG
jgi:AraC-like DNA-binding protein